MQVVILYFYAMVGRLLIFCQNVKPTLSPFAGFSGNRQRMIDKNGILADDLYVIPPNYNILFAP